MVALTFATSTVEQPRSFEPLKPGTYTATVSDIELKTTNAGTGSYLNLKIEILEGEYANRIVFEKCNIVNPSQVAQEIGQGKIGSLAAAIGMGGVDVPDTDVFLNKPIKVELKIQPGSNGYGPSNEVVRFGMLSGAGAAPAPTPIQQASPAQMAQQHAMQQQPIVAPQYAAPTNPAGPASWTQG